MLKKIKLYYTTIMIILFTQCIYTIYIINTTELTYLIKHYLGFTAILLITYVFLLNFNLGRVFFGFVILIGLFGGIALTPELHTTFLRFNFGQITVPIFYGQPIFLIWLILHLLLSYKIYYGMLSKNYWKNLL